MTFFRGLALVPVGLGSVWALTWALTPILGPFLAALVVVILSVAALVVGGRLVERRMSTPPPLPVARVIDARARTDVR